MKAKHLIEALKALEPDDEVMFQMQSGCCGDVDTLEPVYEEPELFVYSTRRDQKIERFVLIDFKPLPGYFTCRQAGSTIRGHEEYMKRLGKTPDGTKIKK
jgi:hypothetical protein